MQPLHVECDGASATIHRRTPRTDMLRTAMVNRSLAPLGNVAAELGVARDVIDSSRGIVRFLDLSTRASDLTGADFELIVVSDTEADIERKWRAFLDTSHMAFVLACEDAMARLDAPADPALAPHTTPAAPTEKKGGRRSKSA